MKLTKEEILKATECCCHDNGSCAGCPLENVKMAELEGRTCVQFLLGQYRGLIEAPNATLDIPRIIDEAMEKKDRSVTIFIGKQGTTVNVYPYQETKPHWIRLPAHRTFECSECGISEQYESPYCPGCGEKLAISDTFYECNKCRNSNNGLCDECMRCKDNSNFKPIEKPEVTENEQETSVE